VRTAAGLVSILLGLGFGIPGVLGARHLSRTGEVWTLLGFPTYEGGPFTRLGIETSVPLLLGFVVVCAAEVALGVAILVGAPFVGWASTLLLVLEVPFWIGFALPFGPVLGLARVGLLLAA
jgi:hypothetical protein